jgi:glycosyltransferase involved in cell wall biosynthesis
MSVTAIITTFNNPVELAARAIASAEAQTLAPSEIIITLDAGRPPAHDWHNHRVLHTNRPDDVYGSWREAVYRATSEYVAILHDDDWWEPTFLERCLSLMRQDVGFVFSRQKIHFSDRAIDNFAWIDKTGHCESRSFAAMLRSTKDAMSPSCVVARRADLLTTIIPGGVPFAPRRVLCGPDLLITALLLLRYPLCGHVHEPLCNALAHEGSTTMRACLDGLADEMQRNYDLAWRFYDAVAPLVEEVR